MCSLVVHDRKPETYPENVGGSTWSSQLFTKHCLCPAKKHYFREKKKEQCQLLLKCVLVFHQGQSENLVSVQLRIKEWLT